MSLKLKYKKNLDKPILNILNEMVVEDIYNFSLINDSIYKISIDVKDVNLLNALENSDHIVENEEDKNMEDV